jgi:hypothetical protein
MAGDALRHPTVAGELVLLGMPESCGLTKRSHLGRGCAPKSIEIVKNSLPVRQGYEGQMTGATWRPVTASRLFC